MDSRERKITPEDKKTLYISVLMVVALSVVSFWRFKNLDFSTVSFSSSFPESEAPPSFQEILSEGKLEEIMKESGLFPDKDKDETRYKREKIEDRVLFDYPSSWREIAITESENENIDFLFLSFSREGVYPGFLTILKIEANDIDEVVEIAKEETAGENIVVEKSEKGYLLKINHSPIEGAVSFSQAKAISVEEHFYLFMVTSFKESSLPSSVTDYILSSVQIIE